MAISEVTEQQEKLVCVECGCGIDPDTDWQISDNEWLCEVCAID